MVNETNHTVAVAAGDSAVDVADKIAIQLITDVVAGYTINHPAPGVVKFTSTTANTNVQDLTVSIPAN
ncbi:hypothetical protein AS29_008390 [Bacillus sp. SJS]|nr:hypothetical protein AS29_008390 [Bacillus sp. SJS]